MSSELHKYFQQVRSRLQLDPQADDEVLRELRTHVDDRLEELRDGGASEEEAVRMLLRRLDSPRSLVRRYQEAHVRATWHDALLAGLPFLLIAALFATHLWSQPVVAFAATASIVGVTFEGLRQRRPPWFYAWAGLALTLLSFCGYFAFGMGERGLSMIGSSGLDLVSGVGLIGAVVYFPLALVVLLSCIVAASRRDWLDASFMLAPSLPVVVWISALNRGTPPGELPDPAVTRFDGPMTLVFLALALLVAAYVRLPLRSLKLGMMAAATGLLLISASVGLGGETSIVVLLAQAVAVFGVLLAPAVVDVAASSGEPARVYGRLSD